MIKFYQSDSGEKYFEEGNTFTLEAKLWKCVTQPDKNLMFMVCQWNVEQTGKKAKGRSWQGRVTISSLRQKERERE